MYVESNFRSILKGVSYRLFGSLTTMVVVYFFFGELTLALFTGIIETVSKIILFYLHERVWNKIMIGRTKITPFTIWFTGLPLSGKTTIGDIVYEKLQKFNIPLERIDSKDIRDLIPEIGFEREERIIHIQRVGHLIKTLQNNSISVVASFVSPYRETRKLIRNMTENAVIVYVKADIDTCKTRDTKGKYAKALAGEIPNFTGVSDIYEEPSNPDIEIDTTNLSPEEAAEIIVKFVKEKYIS